MSGPEDPSSTPEPRNDLHHRFMSLPSQSLIYFQKAAEYYKGLLDEAWKKVEQSKDLLALFDEEEVSRLPFNEERERVDDLISWLSKKIQEVGKHGRVFPISLDHETVRWIKSLCVLFEGYLRERRDELVAEGDVPEVLIESLDLRLAQSREARELTVFRSASPVPLLISGLSPASVKEQAERVELVERSKPAPVLAPDVVHRPYLLDDELRSRCSDLYEIFTTKSLEERLDTVLREAGTIVEARLRKACGAPDEVIGVRLATYAFGGSSPRLRLSDQEAEQEGIHRLFLGFFGWIRNPVGHRLLGKLSRERVSQLLGFADYLLMLVGDAASAPALGAPSAPPGVDEGEGAKGKS